MRHPECPERLELTTKRLEELPAGIIDWAIPSAEPSNEGALEARKAALNAVLRLHDGVYVDYVERVCREGGGGLDGDTYVAPPSYELALLAQSAWLDAVDYTFKTSRPSFALVRPPGHHALKARGMGFCSFNFVACAATYALEKYGLNRVAILDWDVHHGNGVAALVDPDSRIRYCSLHEDGNFPNTGKETETGKAGHSNLLHIPMQVGSGWAEYENALRVKALPWLDEFEPDLVFVSAGYDGLSLDPLARQELSANDFGNMTTLLRAVVGDRLVLGLEGGYSLDPDGLPAAVAATIEALAAPSQASVKHASFK